MQILPRSKMHLHLSTRKKDFLITLSIRRFLFLMKRLLMFMSNYIPNETKVFDDQKLPWMNPEIENLITAKYDVFKKHLKNSRNHYTYKYKVLQQKLEI